MASLAIVFLIAIVGFLGLLTFESDVVSAPTTYYVGGAGGGNYSSIQEAINDSSDGDTVFVYNGTYYENVIVNKTVNLVGEDRRNTMINGSKNEDVLRIEANWVNITGFSFIEGGSLINDAGIELDSVQYCNVFGNDIFLCDHLGIYLFSSNENNITDNTVYLNYGIGICLDSSLNNNIINNNLIENTIHAYDNGNNNWGNDLYKGGNFWDNWTAPDTDKNGFVDNRYNISGGSCFDLYPFSNIWGWDLKGCWHHDEGEGPFAMDSSGNENNGTLKPTYPTNAPDWTYGFKKSALEFDGHDDYIEFENDGDLNITEAITIEAWIKLNSLEPGVITSKPGAYYLGLNYEYKLAGGIFDGDNWRHVKGNTMLLENIWYHVTFTYNGYHLKLYLNGNLDGESAYTGAISPILSNNFYVGSQIFLDDFSVYAEGSNGAPTYDFEDYGIRPDQRIENGSYHFSGDTADEPISIIRGFNASDMIVEARVKTTSQTGGAYICPRFLTVEDKYEIVLDLQWSNVLLNKVVNNVWTKINSTSLGYTILNDTWYTLKGRIKTEGSYNRINIWVNDVLYINQTDSDLMDYTKLAILAFDWNNPFDIHFDDLKVYIPFNGTIDEVRIWARALSPFEIEEQYRSYLTDTIFLYEGWNLISTPYVHFKSNLDTVLSSIIGSYDALQWYDSSEAFDSWKHNHISKPPSMNDFNFITNTMGFWIHVTESGGVLFEYTGMPPQKEQTITLHTGWNMVGYPSLKKYNITKGLNNLTFGVEVDSIWTFDAETKTWEEIGLSDWFEPERGYWIHVNEECHWEVPL